MFELNMEFELLENSIKIPLTYSVAYMHKDTNVKKKVPSNENEKKMRVKSIEATDPYYYHIFSIDYSNGIIYLMLELLPV